METMETMETRLDLNSVIVEGKVLTVSESRTFFFLGSVRKSIGLYGEIIKEETEVMVGITEKMVESYSSRIQVGKRVRVIGRLADFGNIGIKAEHIEIRGEEDGKDET